MLPGVAGSGLASAMQHCSSHRPLKYPSSKALRPHMSGPIGIPAFSRRFSKMAVSMTAIYVEFLKGFDNQTFHWNFAKMDFSELADSTTPSHMEWPATAARRGPGCVLPRPARTMLWRLWQWVTSLLDNLLANQLTQGRQLHGSIPIQPMPQSSIYPPSLSLAHASMSAQKKESQQHPKVFPGGPPPQY